MNSDTKKTIVGIFAFSPIFYMGEEIVVDHSVEPHAAEKIVNTTPILVENTTLSGTVTPYPDQVNFINNGQYSYNQTT